MLLLTLGCLVNCERKTWYVDLDGDGYGGESVEECYEPEGYITLGGDCDDDDPSVKPDAAEICNGVDDDCDGLVDDEDPEIDPATAEEFFEDADGDGYGELETRTLFCEEAEGYVRDSTDCDDSQASVFPGAIEVCDGQVNRCGDDLEDEESDEDGDGWVLCELEGEPAEGVLGGEDCDDADETVHPEAEELCDGLDNDCDEALADSELDDDGDGFVDCTLDGGGWDGESEPGFEDCHDEDLTVFPGAEELCDGQDNDCDGLIPEDEQDADGDGYVICEIDADGWDGSGSLAGEDCDDTEATTNPDADEVCQDGVDNNCDGERNGCRLEGAIAAADADAKLLGGSEDGLGAEGALALADVDGDGAVEVILGVQRAGTGGVVYVVQGTTTGGTAASEASRTLKAEDADDYFGSSIAVADADGDGADDLVVGAVANDDGAANAGSAYLFLGSTSGLSAGNELDFYGTETSQALGKAVALGDVDDDGVVDLLAANSGYDSSTGRVWIVHGPLSGTLGSDQSDATISGNTSYFSAGQSLSFGDLDGDGVDELMVSAPGDGSVAVYSGGVDGNLEIQDAAFEVNDFGDGHGRLPTAVGDLDGDGWSDLLVGAPYYGPSSLNYGAVFVFSGPLSATVATSAAQAVLAGSQKNLYAGWAISSAGDVDGDGEGDVVVGAYGWSPGTEFLGRAYLMSGPVSGSATLSDYRAAVEGESAGDALGYLVAGGGDVDGDGFDDLLLGAGGDDDGGTNAGAAYLFLGGDW